MKCPRKAVLLAAGLGVRMYPLTADMPKAMLPLWGKPVIGHVMDLFRGWGVREILVNAHHCPNPLIRYLLDRPQDGLEVNISFEPNLLGTGGALKRAAWFPDDEPFWMVNTDIAADVSPLPFLSAFGRNAPLAALWLNDHAGPRTVEMAHGRIVNFRSNRPRSAGTYTFCGLQLVSPRLLRHFPPSASFSLVEVYERAMAAGETIRGVAPPRAYWSDLGAPERYLEAHGEVLKRSQTRLPGGCLFVRSQFKATTTLRRRGIRARGFVFVGNDAEIGRGTEIHNSVVLDGARVGSACRLDGAIVARGAVVSGRVEGVATPCAGVAGGVDVVGTVLRRLGWKAAETTVITPGARGSDRSFTRLQRAGRNVIMIRYGLARAENARYAAHARFLRAEGVPVPRVLADIPERRAIVMEYVDGPSLESLAGVLPASTLEHKYRSVLDALVVMHMIPLAHIRTSGPPLEPRFSAEIYSWERELMAMHFLRGRMDLPERTIRPVLCELETIAGRLAGAPQVLVHRDLQSSNILLRGNRPVFIDFQGMRLGPAVYDLASLLCDPYVMLPTRMQESLLTYYGLRAGQPERIMTIFWFAAVQRLAQALGAYSRLGAIPDTAGFARHIRPGLVMMNRALARVEGLDRTKSLVRKLLAE